MKHYLPEMSVEEVREAVERKAVLLVPAATIEQHGPHLPEHTDIDCTLEILKATAESLGENPPTVVSSPIWFAPSPFDPEWAPGSINIRREVFIEVVSDILETYLRSGFKRIAVISGHGGGTEWIYPEIVRRLNTKESRLWRNWKIPTDARVVTFTYFAFLEVFAREELAELRKERKGSDWHSGDIETALQLYLHPELVDMRKAKRGARMIPTQFAPHDLGQNWFWQYIIAGYYGKVERGEVKGVTGDPTAATGELGEKVFRLAVRKIGEFVREFAS